MCVFRNVSKHNYCFSDYPFPEDTPDYPHNADMQNYIRSYVEHFELTPHIHFLTQVNNLKKCGTPYLILIAQSSPQSLFILVAYHVKYICICAEFGISYVSPVGCPKQQTYMFNLTTTWPNIDKNNLKLHLHQGVHCTTLYNLEIYVFAEKAFYVFKEYIIVITWHSMSKSFLLIHNFMLMHTISFFYQLEILLSEY